MCHCFVMSFWVAFFRASCVLPQVIHDQVHMGNRYLIQTTVDHDRLICASYYLERMDCHMILLATNFRVYHHIG